MADKPHITETPDTSYIKNIDVTHEVSDVYIGGIARFAVGLFILMVASWYFTSRHVFAEPLIIGKGLI